MKVYIINPPSAKEIVDSVNKGTETMSVNPDYNLCSVDGCEKQTLYKTGSLCEEHYEDYLTDLSDQQHDEARDMALYEENEKK